MGKRSEVNDGDYGEQWGKLLFIGRYENRSASFSKDRSPFQIDIDRITFSSSFRRLGQKTQVHLLTKNDDVHTRLSHSLEVACVGRSLGVKVGYWLEEQRTLPDGIKPEHIGEIVQAACLAHDIGNPPFGHAAEEAIKEYFVDLFESGNKIQINEEQKRDLTKFDGNAMAFRVLTHKEFYESNGGMRLTYPTLGAVLKYPWTSNATEKSKFSCFQTELKALHDVAEKLKMRRLDSGKRDNTVKYARHPLAYLVEAADDICYKILDLEDAVTIGLLPANLIINKFRPILKLSSDNECLLKSETVSTRLKIGLIRGKLVGRIIDEAIEIFKKDDVYHQIMNGELNGSLLDNVQAPPSSAWSVVEQLYNEEALIDRIYKNPKNILLELGTYNLMETLFGAMSNAAAEVANGYQLSSKTKIVAKFLKDRGYSKIESNSHYENIMMILDYVVSITDRHAISLNKQCLGLGD